MQLLLLPYAVQLNTEVYDLYTTSVSHSLLSSTLAFVNEALHPAAMF